MYLGDWLSRPLDAITRRDVEGRFRLLTERHGEMPANQCLSFLRSVYRRPCVDHEGLRHPVEQWLAAGGRYHRTTRKRISSPAEVLPRKKLYRLYKEEQLVVRKRGGRKRGCPLNLLA